LEKAYAAWRAFQERILAPAAVLLLLGCTLLALLEVVRRYVFGFSYEWQQDAVTFFLLSGVFLYFSISQRHGEHLSVTLLPELLVVLKRPRAAETVTLVAQVFAFLFMAAVAWWGIPEVEDSFKYETRTESLAFPMGPFLAVLWVGFVFMAVTLFFQIYRGIQKLRGRTVLVDPPPPSEEEVLQKAVD
jgi:TRAP-type C4-dicarboxylate transport system permease small subunit